MMKIKGVKFVGTLPAIPEGDKWEIAMFGDMVIACHPDHPPYVVFNSKLYKVGNVDGDLIHIDT